MKVFVISLSESHERRDFQRKQLENLGLAFEIVDAVRAADIGEFGQTISLDRWERPLMPTEAACFFSHYLIWKRISESSHPALVLEDDALVSTRTPDLLRSMEGVSGMDHLTLETRTRRKFLGRSRAMLGGISISRLYQDRAGAAAYVLWPSGARHLVAKSLAEGAALADAFISNDRVLRSFQTIPALAIQSDLAQHYQIASELSTHSYIQAQDNRKQYETHGLQAWAFKKRRIHSQLRQAMQVLRMMLVARRLHVLPDPHGFAPLTVPKPR